jgi:sarcosine oxidase subunit beta
LQLIRDGLANHDTLEEELGENYDWRRIGIFLVIKSEGLWNHWKERSAILTPNGIPTEVIDRKALQKAEPNMNTDGLLGAAYSTEGSLNPLKFSHAYARAAQRFGCEIRGNSKVISLEVDNRKVTSVKTKNETYHCEKVAVMTGAWVPTITRLAGVEVPIRHAHAEALITERIPPMVFNNIELADFYETIHGKAKAVAVGVHPNLHGSLDVTEAITRTEELHKRVSAWGLTALSADLLKLFPFLEKVRVVRSWGRPTSFTPDEEPLVGWIPQLDNMYVATSLVETITTVPLLSEWMAMMIQGQVPQVSMDSYSPSRFINGWTWN